MWNYTVVNDSSKYKKKYMRNYPYLLDMIFLYNKYNGHNIFSTKAKIDFSFLYLLCLLQFVNFTEIMSKNMDRSRKEAEFALSALMEIPDQYKATLELSILG